MKRFGFGSRFSVLALASIVTLGAITFAQPPEERGRAAVGPTGPKTHKYDLLIRGGHVIDAKNKISAVRDVALSDGKIALVAEKIDPAEAMKTVEAKGLYVTPGLIVPNMSASRVPSLPAANRLSVVAISPLAVACTLV